MACSNRVVSVTPHAFGEDITHHTWSVYISCEESISEHSLEVIIRKA